MLTFERAGVADAEEWVPVQVAAFRSDALRYPNVETSGPPGHDSLSHVREYLAADACYAIRENGQLIGGIVLIDHGDGHVHLDTLFIAPAEQSRGIGGRAIAFFEQQHPARRYTLETPSYALRNHHVYEKYGYVAVGARDAPGVTLIQYEKLVGAGWPPQRSDDMGRSAAHSHTYRLQGI